MAGAESKTEKHCENVNKSNFQKLPLSVIFLGEFTEISGESVKLSKSLNASKLSEGFDIACF